MEFTSEQLDAAAAKAVEESAAKEELYRTGRIQRCINGEYFAGGKTTKNELQAIAWAQED